MARRRLGEGFAAWRLGNIVCVGYRCVRLLHSVIINIYIRYTDSLYTDALVFTLGNQYILGASRSFTLGNHRGRCTKNILGNDITNPQCLSFDQSRLI
jgi:hypothetical protein